MVVEEEQLERIWIELNELEKCELAELQKKFSKILHENKKVFLKLKMENLFTKLFVEKFK